MAEQPESIDGQLWIPSQQGRHQCKPSPWVVTGLHISINIVCYDSTYAKMAISMTTVGILVSCFVAILEVVILAEWTFCWSLVQWNRRYQTYHYVPGRTMWTRGHAVYISVSHYINEIIKNQEFKVQWAVRWDQDLVTAFGQQRAVLLYPRPTLAGHSQSPRATTCLGRVATWTMMLLLACPKVGGCHRRERCRSENGWVP